MAEIIFAGDVPFVFLKNGLIMKLPLTMDFSVIFKKITFLKYLAQERGYPQNVTDAIGLTYTGSKFTVYIPRESKTRNGYSYTEPEITPIVIELMAAISDQIKYLHQDAIDAAAKAKHFESICEKYYEDKEEE